MTIKHHMDTQIWKTTWIALIQSAKLLLWHLSVLLSRINVEGKTEHPPNILIFVWLTFVESFLG